MSKVKKNIVTIECLRYTLDWYQEVKVEVDLDEWTFFCVDYRGENSWHLIGHKTVNDKWVQEELSLSGIYRNSLVNFIRAANSYKHKKYGVLCEVSRFNNLHYYKGFYKELADLLASVTIHNPKTEVGA